MSFLKSHDSPICNNNNPFHTMELLFRPPEYNKIIFMNSLIFLYFHKHKVMIQVNFAMCVPLYVMEISSQFFSNKINISEILSEIRSEIYSRIAPQIPPETLLGVFQKTVKDSFANFLQGFL